MSIAEFLKDPETETMTKAAGPAPDSAAATDTEKLRKQVFGIFGSVVVLGLALAGWYVAYRIIAERGTQSTSVALATIPIPNPVASTAPPVAVPAADAAPVEKPSMHAMKVASVPETKPAPMSAKGEKPVGDGGSGGTRADQEARPTTGAKRVPFERHDVNPQPGDKYLQIAAYGPKSLDDYLKRLEAQGRHPLVAPGPADNIYRILVGPFKNEEALEQARRSIETMGIEPILRNY